MPPRVSVNMAERPSNSRDIDLGKGMREFKDAMSGIENEVRNAGKETPPSNTSKPDEPKKID